jgi:hypothetical protein
MLMCQLAFIFFFFFTIVVETRNFGDPLNQGGRQQQKAWRQQEPFTEAS